MANLNTLELTVAAEAQSAESSLDSLIGKLDIVMTKLESLAQYSSKIGDASASPVNVGNDSSVTKMSTDMDNVSAKMDEINGKQINIDANSSSLSDMSSAINDVKVEAGNGLEFPVTVPSGTFDRVNDELGNTQSQVSLATKAVQGFGSALSSIGGAGASTIRGISSAFSDIRSKLKSMKSGSDSSTMSFKKGLNMVLRYGFGIRSLFVLFNKLRRMAKEGFTNLASYSNSTNNALLQLKAG